VNLLAKKSSLLVLAAVGILIWIVYVWVTGQGDGKLIRQGFTPVNEQMKQLIDQTSEASSRDLSSKPTKDGSSGGSTDISVGPSASASTTTPAGSSAPDKNITSMDKDSAKHAAAVSTPSKSTAKASSLVELNTATLAQLDALPGIGESKAKAILAYRMEKGSFKKVEDLLEVKGIGEKMLVKIKPLVYVQQP
jgi:competence protein ComEA